MYYGMAPSALNRGYVKDSLKNTESGFVFEIKNLIDSGSLSGVAKLMVDEVEKPLEDVTIELDGDVRNVTSLSWSSTLYVRYGAKLRLHVPGTLETGEHTIKMTLKIPELGQITMPITDEIG